MGANGKERHLEFQHVKYIVELDSASSKVEADMPETEDRNLGIVGYDNVAAFGRDIFVVVEEIFVIEHILGRAGVNAKLEKWGRFC
jgi:uncharacterized membrane protein